jgi:tetratricopeptide (TPR) repeat protein
VGHDGLDDLIPHIGVEAGFLERATAVDPSSIEVTVTLAEALARSGNNEAALVRARAVLERRDAAPAALAAARRLIRALERPDLPISPAEAAARHARAPALAAEGRNEDALAAFREATDLDPGDPVFWNSRGACAMGQQLAEEALDCYDRAIELAPDVGPLVGSRARALWALGRIDEAAGAFSRWLQLDPDCEEARRAIDVLGGLSPD